ncbi:MAG: hypothetical protein KDM81_03745 [Verrucomicrobiae bacterium]|nr:hypothetical protein [Verrucomicrobiae bacterium]MCP5520540.1 hypothetical protein [Verrucomicrobiales bacterium]
MSPLETRKRLLVLESDLNRALLTAELQGLRSHARWMTEVRRWLPSFRQGLALAAPIASLLRRRSKPKSALPPPAADRKWFARLTDAFRLLGPALLYLRRFLRRRRPRATEQAD